MLQQLRPSSGADNLVAPELAVVIPIFNEAANIEPLLEKLESALQGIEWEAVFVDDDSPDGTAAILIKRCRLDRRVRLLRRMGRRGLASAVTEGILSTSTPYVAVIDGDMQHDERVLPQMLQMLRRQDADLVVGSRYVSEGGVGNWDQTRQKISRIATVLSRLVVKVDLADPMSGFFMIRREAFEAAVHDLSNQGYKILLDVIASSPQPPRIKEVSYTFRSRQHGESKLDALVTLEYISLLLDKLWGKWIPVRFVLFAGIGGLGVVFHMVVLTLLLSVGKVSFAVGQSVATLAAMTFNFFVNNTLTYRDRRLKGLGPLLRGLLTFCIICSVGAVANVGIANVLFVSDYSWWLSALAGILLGAVWNYGVTSIFTWRK